MTGYGAPLQIDRRARVKSHLRKAVVGDVQIGEVDKRTKAAHTREVVASKVHGLQICPRCQIIGVDHGRVIDPQAKIGGRGSTGRGAQCLQA